MAEESILDVAQGMVKWRMDMDYKKLTFEECNEILDVLRRMHNRRANEIENLVVEE